MAAIFQKNLFDIRLMTKLELLTGKLFSLLVQAILLKDWVIFKLKLLDQIGEKNDCS
jgi:hypothetical protein